MIDQTPTILLADDDDDIRRLAELTFEALSDFRMHSFADGYGLIGAVAQNMPDLIILDVMMPHISGPEVLKNLRDQYGDNLAPVVFLTAKVQPSEVERLFDLGVAEVMAKPFSPHELTDHVRRILRTSS